MNRKGHVGRQTAQGHRDELIVLTCRAHDKRKTRRRRPRGIDNRAVFEGNLFEGTDCQRTPARSTFNDAYPRGCVAAPQDEGARTVGRDANRADLPGTFRLNAHTERAVDSPADAHRRDRGRTPHPSEAVHRRTERCLSGQESNRRPTALRVHPVGAAPGDQRGVDGRDSRIGGIGDRGQLRHRG